MNNYGLAFKIIFLSDFVISLIQAIFVSLLFYLYINVRKYY